MSLSDPYVRPTLTALRAQAQQDINASDLPGVDGLLSKAVLRVLAWVMAGFAWLHYDFLDWIYQQSNPWSATGAASLGWGGLVKVSPKDAIVAGTDGLGLGAFPAPATTLLPAGTQVFRLDGFEYVTSADATADGTNTVTAPLLATVAGSAGNAAVSTVLRLGASVEGVGSSGTVTAPIVDGADQESLDAFKARYLQQYAAPAQGGDAADYVNWALAVPGVTRAWVAPNGAGPGTVNIWTMFDVAEAASGGFPVGTNGVASAETRGGAPATGDQLTVANAIYPQRPVTALVYSYAPTDQPQNFTIANLLPNTASMQAAIEAALSDMFLRLGQVGGSIDPNAMTEWGPIYPSDWNEAIDAVPGLIHCTVTSPVAPITPAAGSLFTLGTVTTSA